MELEVGHIYYSGAKSTQMMSRLWIYVSRKKTTVSISTIGYNEFSKNLYLELRPKSRWQEKQVIRAYSPKEATSQQKANLFKAIFNAGHYIPVL